VRVYCKAPCPGGSLPTGGCKQLVKREGDRCPLHGGKPRFSNSALRAILERANRLCGDDQIDTKAILAQLIEDLA
jgi:hypothetical protein